MRTPGILTMALAALLAAGTAFAAPIIAKVKPEWSPFMTAQVSDPTGLVGEARRLIHTDPARVSEVLKSVPQPDDPRQKKVIQGLLADALYQRGQNSIFEAARIYRSLIVGNGDPAFMPWLKFMDANVKKILGFTGEARFAYEEALKTAEKTWEASAAFDLALLDLETGDNSSATQGMEKWLERWQGENGTATVLYGLVEAYVELKELPRARKAYDEARAIDPNGWLARPEIGHRIAEMLEAAGKHDEAAVELEKIGAGRAGTEEGGKSRLATGEMWVEKGQIEPAAIAYAQLVDEKPPPDQLEEAQLRLALLGVNYRDTLELKDPYPAYKEFYRPRQRFEEVLSKSAVTERRQLAEFGLGELERQGGDEKKALEHYERAFQKYPQNFMSGRAYERFIETLEKGIEKKAAAGDAAGGVALYEKYTESAKWAPQRDLGLLNYHAGRAYIGAGMVSQGRKLLQDALYMGTRGVEQSAIKEEILRADVSEKNPSAMAEWIKTHPQDVETKLEYARIMAAKADPGKAVAAYNDALAAIKEPALRIEVTRERDILGVTDTQSALKALSARKTFLDKNPGAPGNREELQEARLRFANGEYQRVIALLEKEGELKTEDRYILALSYRSTAKNEKAAELFKTLAGDKSDPVISGLASFHLDVMALEKSERGRK